MNVLVLTDHATHNEDNSFYGIVNALLEDPRVESVSIATRATCDNRAFFEGDISNGLRAIDLNDKIYFPLGEDILTQQKSFYVDEFDLIWLRLPWPVPNVFFKNLADSFDRSKIINDPLGIIKTSDKAYLLELNQWTPPIALCDRFEDITKFKNIYTCVLKPRQSYGGKGLVKIERDMVFTADETMSYRAFEDRYRNHPVSYLAMKYMERVDKGDKRIVVANERILNCALRTPPAGSWLCNVSMGGKATLSSPTPEEQAMVEAVAPLLKRQGIFLFGLDTLEDETGTRKLSEINTLSVGGIVPSAANSGKPLTRWLIDELFHYLSS